MIKLILIGLGVIILGIAISFIIGRVRETAIVNRMEASASRPALLAIC